MSERLAQVLRAGQAQGVSVHDNTLKVADLGDDTLRLITKAIGDGTLRLITKAIGDGNAMAACLAVRNWCSLNTRHRGMCKGGGDALWTELARHIFVASDALSNDVTLTSEERFYKMCKTKIRANVAMQWMSKHHFNPVFQNPSLQKPQLLDNLGEALQLINNGGFKTSEKRLRLVELVSSIYNEYTDDFWPAKFLDVKELYKMVMSDEAAEIDAALQLLDCVANDYWSVQGGIDTHDGRDGFDRSSISVLKRLLENTDDKQRKAYILGIWRGLTSKVNGMEYEVHGDELGLYARALVERDVDKMLMHDYVVNGWHYGLAGDVMDILANIPRRMNESHLAFKFKCNPKFRPC